MMEENNNIVYKLSPELLTEIFGNLYIHNLFKCALVNKNWSANAMRILWKYPIQLATFPSKNFKPPKERLCSIISTMVKCLSADVKNKLKNNYGIIVDETEKQILPMFDYCSYIEKLNFVMMLKATFFWLSSLTDQDHIMDLYSHRCHYLIFQEICNLVIIKSNILNNQQRNTSEARVILSAYNPRQIMQGEICNGNYKETDFPLPSHLPLMVQPLSRLERVTLSTCIQPRFINELNHICRNIIDISIHCGCCDDQHFADFINNQRKLQKVVIFSLKSDIILKKISESIENKLEQLSSLNISAGQIPLEIFNNKKCDKMIELFIIDNEQPLTKFSDWDQFLFYNNNNSFKKLKKLELHCNIKNLENIGNFLQKLSTLEKFILLIFYNNNNNNNNDSNNNLSLKEEILVDKLFKNISKYSSNLIHLELTTPKFTENLEIILQSCKKLENLNLRDSYYNQSNDLNKRFSLLAQHFPISLKRFGIEFNLNVSKEKVEEFLNYCFKIGIKKLTLGFYFEEFSFEHEIIMKRYVQLGTLNHESFECWLKEQRKFIFEEEDNLDDIEVLIDDREGLHLFDFIRECM